MWPIIKENCCTETALTTTIHWGHKEQPNYHGWMRSRVAVARELYQKIFSNLHGLQALQMNLLNSLQAMLNLHPVSLWSLELVYVWIVEWNLGGQNHKSKNLEGAWPPWPSWFHHLWENTQRGRKALWDTCIDTCMDTCIEEYHGQLVCTCVYCVTHWGY